MRQGSVLLLVALAGLCGGIWAVESIFRAYAPKPFPDTETVEFVERYVRDNAATLERVAIRFRNNPTIKPEAQDVPRPYSVDANSNVYFIVDWTTFANVGFVYRNGEAALLGDGVESSIAESKHLFGDWWYYLAN